MIFIFDSKVGILNQQNYLLLDHLSLVSHYFRVLVLAKMGAYLDPDSFREWLCLRKVRIKLIGSLLPGNI